MTGGIWVCWSVGKDGVLFYELGVGGSSVEHIGVVGGDSIGKVVGFGSAKAMGWVKGVQTRLTMILVS